MWSLGRLATVSGMARGLGLILMLLSPFVDAQETTEDQGLWTGVLGLTRNKSGLDYSVEYQLRLNENMSSFSNHFVEFMAYKKVTKSILFNGGYRFTQRTDHTEHRVYFGGFWKLAGPLDAGDDSNQFRAALQVGYQRDWNTVFDGQSMESNSIRWILVASKPISKTVAPFILAGVLTTWNDAYSFGVDKTRFGAGIVFTPSQKGRLRIQYMLEKGNFVTPKSQTHIVWIRYEGTWGK
jgi:hypothetical protein